MLRHDRYSRQGFLGDHSIFSRATIGLIGLGGGGSVILTQLAHIGFENFVGYDPNLKIEEKHLNRTLGVSHEDLGATVPKVANARRIVERLQPNARPLFIHDRWQSDPTPLRSCDIVFGCVDGFSEREQLELFCRRHLIPYIDIGLGVKIGSADLTPVLAGQVILSMPGQACMKCIGFLNEAKLAQEAQEYGDAGINPQVIWGNMALASAAVGIATKLLTGWAGETALRHPVYLQYDGNQDVVQPHQRLEYLDRSPCPHFPSEAVGAHILRSI